MSEKLRHLLDVNVLVALAARNHVHHELVAAWFYADPTRAWAVCAFTEAGFLRNATAPRPGQITMGEATAVLEAFRQHPGCVYQPITAEWQVLAAPFKKRLYGTKQVTDAYLLGLAVRERLVLVTMERAMLHLAGEEHRARVLLLGDA